MGRFYDRPHKRQHFARHFRHDPCTGRVYCVVVSTTVWWRCSVQQSERQIAFLEGRIEEQVMRIDDVRDAVISLEERLNRKFELLQQQLDQRFDGIDARFGRVYGLLIAMLVAIVSGLGGVIAAILNK